MSESKKAMQFDDIPSGDTEGLIIAHEYNRNLRPLEERMTELQRELANVAGDTWSVENEIGLTQQGIDDSLQRIYNAAGMARPDDPEFPVSEPAYRGSHWGKTS